MNLAIQKSPLFHADFTQQLAGISRKPERNSPGGFSQRLTRHCSNFPASLIWDAFAIFGIHHFADSAHSESSRHFIGC